MEAQYGNNMKLLDYHSEELAPYFPVSTISAGAYPWQPQETKLHATKAILITYNYQPDPKKPDRFGHYHDKIYDLVAVITENIDRLRQEAHPKWQEIDTLDLQEINWEPHAQAVKDVQREANKPVITKAQICRMFDNCQPVHRDLGQPIVGCPKTHSC